MYKISLGFDYGLAPHICEVNVYSTTFSARCVRYAFVGTNQRAIAMVLVRLSVHLHGTGVHCVIRCTLTRI